jgi:RNA polymerase sigma-70 factor (ECF subfamily)
MQEKNEPSSLSHPTVDLVLAAQAGDASAWAMLHERNYVLMRFLIHGRIPRHARARFDTDDVMQSAFLQAFKEVASFENRGAHAFQTWLATLVKRRLVDKIRYNSRHRRDSHRDEPELESGDQRLARSASESPSAIAAAAERVALILGAITKLQARDQELISLRILDKLSWAEIAERLQLGETTARRRFYESFDRLVDKVV